MSQKWFIIADDRERESGIPQLLSECEHVDLDIRRLRTGDYLLEPQILVERKTLSDFAASIVDTRLFKQAKRMANGSYRPLFIVEGGVSDLREVGLSREALQGALISLSLVFNIPVLRSLNSEESSRLLVYIANQSNRMGGNHRSNRRLSGKSLQSKKLKVLQNLPGIGPGKAKSLLQEFESVENCLTASADDLARVPRIGPKTAKAIRQVVSDPPATYNPLPSTGSSSNAGPSPSIMQLISVTLPKIVAN